MELSSTCFNLPFIVLQADIEHITDQYAAVSSDPFGAIGLQPTTASRYASSTRRMSYMMLSCKHLLYAKTEHLLSLLYAVVCLLALCGSLTDMHSQFVMTVLTLL
jgi:hypothetical protein